MSLSIPQLLNEREKIQKLDRLYDLVHMIEREITLTYTQETITIAGKDSDITLFDETTINMMLLNAI